MQNIPESPDDLTTCTGIFLLPRQGPGIFWNIAYYGLWPVGISLIFFWQNTFLKMGKKMSQIPILKIKKICLQVTESCYFGGGCRHIYVYWLQL